MSIGESRAVQPSMLTCVNITQRIDQSISHVSQTFDSKKLWWNYDWNEHDLRP